jgi:hypothetical protein
MTLAIGSLACRRLALGATLFGLAACPADGDEDTDAATDSDPSTTAPTTTSPTTTTTTTTDPSDTSGDTTPVDVDYATDIQPIWDANCIAGCHEPEGITGAEAVDLTAAASYNTLTMQKPVYDTRELFVEAGDADESFLIDALRHDEPTIIVRQMPLLLDTSTDPPTGIEGTPLPEATIVLVEAWINAGANP